MPPKAKHIAERFWSKVQEGPECWLWTGAVNRPQGYGILGTRKGASPVYAHRLSWMLNRSDPEKMFVLHTCDIPRCVNPKHLFLGTASDNSLDSVRKGRHVSGYGEWQRGRPSLRRKLGIRQVLALRELRKRGKTLQFLANSFGISFQTVSKIVRNERYQEGEMRWS